MLASSLLAVLLVSRFVAEAHLNTTAYTPDVLRDAMTAEEQEQLLSRLSKIADAPGEVEFTDDVSTFSSMTLAQVHEYAPYTHLAAASYCPTSTISNWSCGQHCTALPGMQVYASGGNNKEIPDWYVGYLPSLAAVVVVHQGMTSANIESDFIVIDLFLAPLSPVHFPGVPDDVEVHHGFAIAHARTAPLILATVTKLLKEKKTKQVVTIGHSLGAALSLLDALSLKLTLPQGTIIKNVNYGGPRVGNLPFADYADAQLSDVHRITHGKDPIPIVPGRFLGFHHTSGEKHLAVDGTWWGCAGQDNVADPQCATGEVGNIFKSNVWDHLGPWGDGILMDCYLN